MAKAAHPQRKDKKPIIQIMVVVVLLAGGAWLMTQVLSAARERAIDRSSIGVAALANWLTENDVAARMSHPRIRPSIDDLSLRVLPLYDLNLDANAVPPTTEEERGATGNIRDLTFQNFETKVDELPTLVALPKWRAIATRLDILHQQALIPPIAFEVLMDQIGLSKTQLRQAGAEIQVFRIEGHEVALFHAQTFAPASLPKNCMPDVMFGTGVLIAKCDVKVGSYSYSVWFLSDPDLLNNHGLGLADNAEFVVQVLSNLQTDQTKSVYVDVETSIQTRLSEEPEGLNYDRGQDELARFLQYPFSLYWAAFLIFVAIAYWRGAFRFGPIKAADEHGWEQSKTSAIAAKSRLLRLSGNDGAIASEFVSEQLRRLSIDHMGHDQPDEGGKRFFTMLARRDAKLAQELSTTANALIKQSTTMSPRELEDHLQLYHSLLQKVLSPNEPV